MPATVQLLLPYRAKTWLREAGILQVKVEASAYGHQGSLAEEIFGKVLGLIGLGSSCYSLLRIYPPPCDANAHRIKEKSRMYSDEMLTCVDCGRTFPFTANEQEFYASKGFTNKPSRCADCRAARKASGGRSGGGGGGGGGGARREMFKATCSQCGGVAEVPFQPRGDKPVYCRDCFASRPSYR